jgi:two-component system CheB/CheR fusion protein
MVLIKGGEMIVFSSCSFAQTPISSPSNTFYSKAEPLPRKEDECSVLIVDDTPDIALMLACFLEKAGYRARPVFSAGEALDAARSERFDVIISDIGLPGMDGYELAKELRALREYVSTPLIAVTGFAEYGDQKNAFDAGFDAHLTKPVDPTKLIELIGQLGC